MRSISRKLFIFLALAGAFWIGGCSSSSTEKDDAVRADGCGANGTELVSWGFERGLYPDGWGWGEWYVEDGALVGCHDSGWVSAYFTPFPCPENFAIETRVMFVSSLEGENVEAQLLVRDDEGLVFESGLVLHVGDDVVSCRHMAWKRDLLYERYHTGFTVEYDRWYSLCFSLYKGRIRAELDGRPIPVPDMRYPVGAYREPHLAVKNGCARFDYVRILSLG